MLFHDFASWNPNSSLTALAGMAQPDEWDYRRTTSEKALPILRNYVVYTFQREHFQNRVAFSEGQDGSRHAVFNTGLLTPHFEGIYGYFIAQSNPDFTQPWFLGGFYRESDQRLLRFQKLPDRASYFDAPADLLFDPRLDLRIQYEHIVNDNVSRFPDELRDDENRRVEAVRQAIQHAEFRVQQNYKAAIPQFYWPSRSPSDPGKLQLLLPLCLQDFNRADLALSIDKVGAVYRAATVLTLDMAYNNARLIARPDREWLEPQSPAHANAEADGATDHFPPM